MIKVVVVVMMTGQVFLFILLGQQKQLDDQPMKYKKLITNRRIAAKVRHKVSLYDSCPIDLNACSTAR